MAASLRSDLCRTSELSVAPPNEHREEKRRYQILNPGKEKVIRCGTQRQALFNTLMRFTLKPELDSLNKKLKSLGRGTPSRKVTF